MTKSSPTSTIKPRALKNGDCIGIVALSEPVDKEQLERGLNRLQSDGFRVKLGKHLFERVGHLAGTDVQRAGDLMEMFTDMSVDAIFCGSGGANGARILPLLDYNVIAKHPKIMLGMSDPTSILCGIHAKTGLVTFHGPVVQYNFSCVMTPMTVASFQREILNSSKASPFSFKYISLHGGKATGQLIGGNLTTLQQLIGTPYEPNWEGRILFWEDVCEQPHALDAKLAHFRNAGIFDKIAGMIVGVLEACVENDYPEMPPIEEIILELTEKRFPIITGVPLGHTDDKITMPIGINVSIDGKKGTFTMEEKGVIVS